MRPFPVILVTALLAACGPPPGTASPEAGPVARVGTPPSVQPPRQQPAAPAAPADAPWLDPRGTSIVGFGILRLVPGASGRATCRIRYRETPDGYATTGNLQLFVLPGDAFARSDRAWAGDFLAFTRTEDEAATGEDGALRLETTVTVASETTVLVCYGPWTAPDAGRPAGDVPTFALRVSSEDGAWAWVESEAGELITTNWTNRPEVARGTPCRDAVGDRDLWIEVRPMILYDGRLARAADEPAAPPGAAADVATARALRDEADALDRAGRGALATDRRERAADLEAVLARADPRLVLVPPLAEKLRRVPIRWR